MIAEARSEARFAALVAAFPLTPIRDVGSYRAAIAVLDHLFTLGNRHPEEQRYFRVLARQARNYEQAHSPI